MEDVIRDVRDFAKREIKKTGYDNDSPKMLDSIAFVLAILHEYGDTNGDVGGKEIVEKIYKRMYGSELEV